MKRLLLVFALTIFAVAPSFAERTLKEKNEAAIVAGHNQLSSKISTLKSNVRSNNTTATEATVNEIMQLMRAGMRQIGTKVDLMPYEQAKASSNQYMEVEKIVYSYSQLAKDIPANKAKLITTAEAFLQKY